MNILDHHLWRSYKNSWHNSERRYITWKLEWWINSIFYLENPGSVFVPDIQDISNIPNNNLFNGNQKINLQKTNMWKCEKCNKCVNVKTTQENMSLATYDNILNEIKNF